MRNVVFSFFSFLFFFFFCFSVFPVVLFLSSLFFFCFQRRPLTTMSGAREKNRNASQPNNTPLFKTRAYFTGLDEGSRWNHPSTLTFCDPPRQRSFPVLFSLRDLLLFISISRILLLFRIGTSSRYLLFLYYRIQITKMKPKSTLHLLTTRLHAEC